MDMKIKVTQKSISIVCPLSNIEIIDFLDGLFCYEPKLMFFKVMNKLPGISETDYGLSVNMEDKTADISFVLDTEYENQNTFNKIKFLIEKYSELGAKHISFLNSENMDDMNIRKGVIEEFENAIIEAEKLFKSYKNGEEHTISSKYLRETDLKGANVIKNNTTCFMVQNPLNNQWIAINSQNEVICSDKELEGCFNTI